MKPYSNFGITKGGLTKMEMLVKTLENEGVKDVQGNVVITPETVRATGISDELGNVITKPIIVQSLTNETVQKSITGTNNNNKIIVITIIVVVVIGIIFYLLKK